MTASSPSQKTVLVATDTAFVRDRFKTALDAAGHRAVVVKSVAQLLARVRADLADLDLIVLDLRMPHASGVDLVQRIRKLDEGHLPILVFSGTVTSAEEVRQLAALGVGGYINEYSAVEHILPSIAPHLFPEIFNRRDSARVVMGIPVSYRAGGKIAAALSLNLSRGGLAVRTSGPLARGAAPSKRTRNAIPSDSVNWLIKPGDMLSERPETPACASAGRPHNGPCTRGNSRNRISIIGKACAMMIAACRV